MTIAKSETYLSSVLGRPVITAQGHEIGRLRDLAISPGRHFPEVSNLLVQQANSTLAVPWSRVNLFNRYVISVTGSQHNLPEYRDHEADILLKRDILDRQIVDVNGAKVVRVNDLELGTSQERLCVFYVDVGLRSLLRRMGAEQVAERIAALLGRPLQHQSISWRYVQLLEKNLAHLTLTVARDQLKEIHPADLAQIISNIPSGQVPGVLNSLAPETAGEALHELAPELKSRIISELDSVQACGIISGMDPDEAADALGHLPEEKGEELLGLLDEEAAQQIKDLMLHREDTAGGLMNSQFIAIPAEISAGDALQVVKSCAAEVDTIYYLYVLDQHEHLEGVVSLKDLLTRAPETVVAYFMNSGVKSVHVDSSPDEVMGILAKYNFVAVPVLDQEERMAGIVSVDDVLELYIPPALRRKRHKVR